MATLTIKILNRAAAGEPDEWVAVASDGDTPMGAWTFEQMPARDEAHAVAVSQYGAYYDEIVVELFPLP